MPDAPRVSLAVRVAFLRHALGDAVRARRVHQALRAVATVVSPRRWPPLGPGTRRPGTAAARLRAELLDAAAATLPPDAARGERAVATYLRAELGSPPPAAARRPPALDAASAADRLRAAGHADPIVVATFPGFHPNPFGSLMERGYEAGGLAAVHVTDPAGVDAIVAGQEAGGYRTVVHLNAPDRFVGDVATPDQATGSAARALLTIDGWLERGATLVVSVHNGPRLTGPRGVAEQAIAQGIFDRAHLVHLLSASTPALLAAWVRFDPGRCRHIPHPNYDGVYPPAPGRDEARARIGIPAGAPGPLIVGMVGSLVARKGALRLLDALNLVPERLADGRGLRLLVAGSPVGAGAEDLIRRGAGDPRVITRFGYIDDAEMPGLLASLDAAVIPYHDVLNSGWLHLALTAAIPVIAPEQGTASEIVVPAALRTFAGGDTRSLATALAAASELDTIEARTAARSSVADLGADRLSREFVQAVLEAVRTAAREGPPPSGQGSEGGRQAASSSTSGSSAGTLGESVASSAPASAEAASIASADDSAA